MDLAAVAVGRSLFCRSTYLLLLLLLLLLL
jgi:hypothetical protein